MNTSGKKNNSRTGNKILSYEQLLVLLFLIVISIAAGFALQTLKKQTQKDKGSALQTVLNTTQQGLHYWIDNRKNDIEEFSKNPYCIAFTKKLITIPEIKSKLISCPIQEEIRAFFTPVLQAKKYEGIFIISKNNINLSSMRNENIGDINLITIEYPELLAKAFAGEFIFIPPLSTDLNKDQNKHKTTMFIAAPIMDTNNDILAVLTFRLDPHDDFTRITQLGRIGNSGETYALDKLGYMISDSRFNDQLLNINLIEKINFDYHIKVSDPGGNMINGYIPKKSNAELPLTTMAYNITQQTDSVCTTEYSDYRGVPVIGAWLWDDKLGIGLATEIDAEEAFSQYNLTRKLIIILIAITAFIAIILIQVLIRTRKRNENQLIKLNADLEERVEVRTAMLSQANIDLGGEIDEHQKTQLLLIEKNNKLESTISQLKQAQSQLIQSEKMASLGNLIAGIAHEINTPIGAIKASLGNLDNSIKLAINAYLSKVDLLNEKERDLITQLYLKSQKSSFELSSRERRVRKKEIIRILEEQQIKDTSTISETLLYMGIYEGFEDLIPLIKEAENVIVFEKAKTLASLYKNKNTIALAADKAAKTVFALKKFSHKGIQDEMQEVDIIDGIETILTIYHNQIKYGVEVVREYKPIPPILGIVDEITQVWTNLIHNAIQAMNHNGTIVIRTYSENGNVYVSIKDSGKGIPKEIADRIFEPFFTTKPAGEGTGIGLDIVKKIIENHKGSITFESIPDIGTTFTVSFPELIKRS
ncbi:MAG: GHKL domain-containing protein [Bacteroidales bacterium]|nr:GHKL domain-containing protein [Bacteroidales bacterium]